MVFSHLTGLILRFWNQKFSKQNRVVELLIVLITKTFRRSSSECVASLRLIILYQVNIEVVSEGYLKLVNASLLAMINGYRFFLPFGLLRMFMKNNLVIIRFLKQLNPVFSTMDYRN